MKKVILFGKEYDKNNLPKEIVLECGCIYKKDKTKIGISYSSKFLCSEHEPKIDLEKMKKEKRKNLTVGLLKKLKDLDYKTIKHCQRVLSDEEFEEVIVECEGYRAKINKIEEKVNKCTTISQLNKIKLGGI